MADLSFLRFLSGIYNLNLSAANSVHNAVIQSIYDCFITAHDDIDAMRLELCISTASGNWLDYWGDFFKVYRKSEETDDTYRKRIIAHTIQPKTTIPAIKSNIVAYINSTQGTDYTEKDVDINEPFSKVAKYSQVGTLSNTTRFYSADYYTRGVIDISIPEDTSQELTDLVNSIKAAGVKVAWSVINSYEILSEFYDVDTAYASYTRNIKTKTQRTMGKGLTLSQSSAHPNMSGKQMIWTEFTRNFDWVLSFVDERDPEKYSTISKVDLVSILEYYDTVEELISEGAFQLSNHNGELDSDKQMSGVEGDPGEHQKAYIRTKVTDEMLATLKFMDDFMKLSYKGRLSTSSGTLFEHTAAADLYIKLVSQIQIWKSEHEEIYKNIQGKIEIYPYKSRVMYYVERNENWIWNTPTLTIEDFYYLWIASDGEMTTLKDFEDFEDMFDRGFIQFGDIYQPPIVMSNHKFYWTTRNLQCNLMDSPVFTLEDAPAVLQRQFDYGPKWIIEDPTIAEIEDLENYNYEKTLIPREAQGAIEITSLI